MYKHSGDASPQVISMPGGAGLVHHNFQLMNRRHGRQHIPATEVAPVVTMPDWLESPGNQPVFPVRSTRAIPARSIALPEDKAYRLTPINYRSPPSPA